MSQWNSSKVFLWSVLLLFWSWNLAQVIYNPMVSDKSNAWRLCIPGLAITSLALAIWIITWIAESWDN